MPRRCVNAPLPASTGSLLMARPYLSAGLAVAVVTLLLTLAGALLLSRAKPGNALIFDSEVEYRASGGESRSIWPYIGWFALLPAMAWVLGFFIAAPIYVLIFLRVLARATWKQTILGTFGIALFLWLARDFLYVSYPQGLLETWFNLPHWLE